MKRSAVVAAWFWALFGALFLAGAGWCAASQDTTFTGVIYDNRCSDGVCATQCPVTKTPKYTLQTETEGWLLTDQKTPARYLGKKVVITGHLTGGNKLKVVSISPAVAPAAYPAT